MNAKEFFQRNYYLEQRVNSRLRRLSDLRQLAGRVTSSLGREPVSGSADVHKLDGTIAKIKVTQSKQVPGMNARGQMRLQVIKDDIINVRVPLVTTSEGRRVVDIQALKKAAIEELSTWRPSSSK